MSKKKHDFPNNKPITVYGIEYNSVRKAIFELGLERKENSIRRRLKKGYTPDEAFGLIGPRTRGISITVYGKKYSSIGKAISELGLEEKGSAIRRRLKKGYTPDEAFGLIGPRTRGISITVYGKEYSSIGKAIFELDLKKNESAIRHRLKLGYTPDEAFGEYLKLKSG